MGLHTYPKTLRSLEMLSLIFCMDAPYIRKISKSRRCKIFDYLGDYLGISSRLLLISHSSLHTYPIYKIHERAIQSQTAVLHHTYPAHVPVTFHAFFENESITHNKVNHMPCRAGGQGRCSCNSPGQCPGRALHCPTTGRSRTGLSCDPAAHRTVGAAGAPGAEHSRCRSAPLERRGAKPVHVCAGPDRCQGVCRQLAWASAGAALGLSEAE